MVVEKAVEIVIYISKKCNAVQTKGSVTTKQKIVDYSKLPLVHYEAGSMQTVSKSIFTSSSGGFVIQSDIENFDSGSISLSSNNKYFNAALNIQNISNYQLSLSLNIRKKEITFSTGVENGWLTLMSSTQKDVGGGAMEGYYDKASFSPLSLAFAKEAAIGISFISSTLGCLLSFTY